MNQEAYKKWTLLFQKSEFASVMIIIVSLVTQFVIYALIFFQSDALNYRLPSNFGYIAGIAVCSFVAIAAVYYIKRGS